MRFRELKRIVDECESLNKLTQSYQSGTAGRGAKENRRTVYLRFRGREDEDSMSLKTDVGYIIGEMHQSDDLFVSLEAAASESLVMF